MFRKLRNNPALASFAVILMLSVFGIIAVTCINLYSFNFRENSFLVATKLEQKPDRYFLLENPDNYVLQAIINEDKPVSIGTSKIFELISMHNTSNVEYNNEYYNVGILLVDPYRLPAAPFLIGAFISSVGIAIIKYSKTTKS